MKKNIIIILALFLLAYATYTYAFAGKSFNQEVESANEEGKILEENGNEGKFKEVIFRATEINEDIEKRINGVSWKEGAPVELSDLRYLELTYVGFDNKAHIGEMIVNKYVADEVVEIFRELYEAEYQIEKIGLIDDYDALDALSMADNNTSSFCYRVVEGTITLSKHAYGIAIDINPLQNPYVKGDIVEPVEGKDYVDRSSIKQGMIMEGDACYEAFKTRGWTWGGEWNSLKDYQHFQKDVDINEL